MVTLYVQVSAVSLRDNEAMRVALQPSRVRDVLSTTLVLSVLQEPSDPSKLGRWLQDPRNIDRLSHVTPRKSIVCLVTNRSAGTREPLVDYAHAKSDFLSSVMKRYASRKKPKIK